MGAGQARGTNSHNTHQKGEIIFSRGQPQHGSAPSAAQKVAEQCCSLSKEGTVRAWDEFRLNRGQINWEIE